ncbi:MAG TPA: tripartite tricarboxylate transporter TctB family protein [Afifellaceae bacterium]|nr:tripartite tricarboxylate transporter TctB family protein [Afifellaceae bacterium]
MRIGGTRYRIEWGHLLLLFLIAGIVIWYLFDARGRSVNINNLLLVQPAAILALILCAVVLRQCFVPVSAEEPEVTPEARRDDLIAIGRVAAMALAFGLFAFSLETIGFDVAAWLFVAVGLFICGERRSLVLVLFPTVFTAALIYFFRALIPFPLPTFVF